MRNALVCAIVVAALLLCHGALGSIHQADAAGGMAKEESASIHHGSEDGWIVSYAAVLAAISFSVLLGAYLRVLRRIFRWVRYSVLWSQLPSVDVAHYARGPTMPLLQVFRL